MTAARDHEGKVTPENGLGPNQRARSEKAFRVYLALAGCSHHSVVNFAQTAELAYAMTDAFDAVTDKLRALRRRESERSPSSASARGEV